MLGFKRFWRPVPEAAEEEKSEPDVLAAKYEHRDPHVQKGLDLIGGWNCAFPPEYGVTAGQMALYSDARVHWALDQYGPMDNTSVLELGPLEGSHSYILEKRGAAEILAIEANKQAFFKCLLAKEIYGLTRCRYLLGDFEKFLAKTDRHFDIIMASGVLYHMQNPVEVLDMICRKCDALILLTHYFDPVLMPQSDPRRRPFSDQPEHFEYHGHRYTLHRRTYHHAWQADSYCGGPDDTHYWMLRSDIEALCKKNGFDDIRLKFENADGANGPSCLYFMRKTA